MNEYNYWEDAVKRYYKQIWEHVKQFEEAIMPLMDEFTKAIKNLPKDIMKVQSYLTDQGWYISPELTIDILRKLADMIDNQKHKKIESFILEFAKSRVSKTEQRIKNHWPMREKILDDAFNAHEQGIYTLSIPVMLAQADGICFKILKVFLFSIKKEKPRTGRALDQFLKNVKVSNNEFQISSGYNPFLKYLRSVSSVMEYINFEDKKNQNNQNYRTLNRHSILHGIDINYYTEANSLRAILILDYLVWLKEILESHTKRAEKYNKLLDEINHEKTGKTIDN